MHVIASCLQECRSRPSCVEIFTSVWCAGDMPVLQYDDHADSMSVEIEMRDIMGGDQPAHAHSMDDVNLMLDDGGGGQVPSIRNICLHTCVA